MTTQSSRLMAFAVCMFLGAHQPAHARITRIVINTRVPAYGGFVFPNTGAYEQLDGIAYGEVDPHDPVNAVVTDLKLAPRNARGLVEYSTDISILKPVDMSRSNGTLLYEDVNRGNKNSTSFNIGGNATQRGDGFLESRATPWHGPDGRATPRTGSRSICPWPGSVTAATSPARSARNTSSCASVRRGCFCPGV